MEFDRSRYGRTYDWATRTYKVNNATPETLMEGIARKWRECGYQMPKLIFWNVDARQNNIPMKLEHGISFVSGFSPSIFQQIMSGKTAMDLMYEVLNQKRYEVIC